MKRLAATAFVALLLAATPTFACSMVPIFRDGGRYVGGDLVTQIAARADTIQIVRVVHRMPIGVDARGERLYAFQFEVVETLARRGGGPVPHGFSLDGYARTAARGATEGPQAIELWLDPDVMDHPGSADGYRQLRAPGPASLNTGSCGWPMRVALREEFLVLRRASGRLYAFEEFGSFEDTQAEPLPIYFTYVPVLRTIATTSAESAPAPPLIRIESRQDPFLVRLRRSLESQPSR